MAEFRFDRAMVRHAFGRAAPHYEKHDVLQRATQEILLDRLDFHAAEPALVVDVGAATGQGSAALKARWPRAEVIALDVALPMLVRARRHARWLKPFRRVCGEATRLPLRDHSVDVLYANLCFQWIEDRERLFAECVRVLKPGGLIAFTSLGPDTLKELRAAWAHVDQQPHVARFLDMHDVGDAMLTSGLRDPVLSVERFTLTYPTPRGVLDDLKGLGATNADAARTRGLTSPRRYRAMLEHYEKERTDGVIPATWEVIIAHAFGPEPGQPRRVPGGGEIATFSIDNLRRSRRPKSGSTPETGD